MSNSATAERGGILGFRELQRYPSDGVRYASLAVVVMATVVLYYQLYLSGGVAVDIIKSYGISFKWFVLLNVAALVIAAVAAHFGGLADRFGRANMITVGLVIVGLLCLVGVPNCNGRWAFAIVFCAINAVEGVILVATPAMVRDFSPQLGRASAMAFWTMGPVIGSLVVTSVVGSGTGSSGWRHEYVIAGICGLIVAALSVPLLRELSPALRDQVMVEQKDRILIEARIAGIDVAAAQKNPVRQMVKPDIIISSVAISLFLMFYISMVAFGPTYMQANFGYSQSRANNVLIWAWAPNILGLMLAGFISDKLLVRKPLMLVGAIVFTVSLIVFIGKATDTSTTYNTFAVLYTIIFFSAGFAYVSWMAAFTETVERRNPALTATGLAVWGLIIRFVFAAIVLVAPYIVTTVNTLVDSSGKVAQIESGHAPGLSAGQNATVLAVVKDPTIVPKVLAIAAGKSPDLTASQNSAVAAIAKDPTIPARVQTFAATHAADIKTAQEIDPATQATLLTNPTDGAAIAKAVGDIVKAEGISPAAATAKLLALAKVPTSDLLMVQQYGPALQNKTVVATLLYLQKWGPALQDPQVKQTLEYLQGLQKSAVQGQKQWQKYFWITAAGSILFIPMIWLMAGFWMPKRAREALLAHEAAVAAELAAVRA